MATAVGQILALQLALKAARAEISKLNRDVNALKKTVGRDLQTVRRDAMAAAQSSKPSAPGCCPSCGCIPREADAVVPAAATGSNGPSRALLRTGEWGMTPIGFVESAFVLKNGTPRQPGLVSAAPARLQVRWGSSPAHALEGLEAFSHAWLLFVFDRNGGEAVKAKARPPRLGGSRTGVFACRTPHRPNPIGLSLVALRSVEGNVLTFDGADLCDGTPVLDIKPYVPYADTPPPAGVRAAGWVSGGPAEGERAGCRVIFSPEARDSLHAICNAPEEEARGGAPSSPPALRFFRGKPEQAQAAFQQSLATDPRSIYRREKCADLAYFINLDGLTAECHFDGNDATVEHVRLASDGPSNLELDKTGVSEKPRVNS